MKNATRSVLLLLTLLLGGATGSAAAAPGEWNIEPVAAGFEATWTSPEPLPVTSDRPEVTLDGKPLGYGTVSVDGRRVTVTIPGGERPDAARLAVRLSGQTLDGPEPSATPASAPFSPTEALSKVGFDPGRKGPHRVTADNYRRPSFRYPGFRRKVEMEGHVVAPADPAVAADGPLVLFLHGRHSTCFRPGRGAINGRWPCRKGMKPIPSQLGYDYLQRVLASQGYVTVSIAANGINGQDDAKPDGGANARAALVRRHLDLWSGWVADGRRRADLGRVVLIGHSRGGEGVNRAAEVIPAGAPYRVAGQMLLAPTNFARQSAAYVPTVTVLPYCDGDVYDLQGQAYTDGAIGLAAGDRSLKSSVTMFGANHNFFNTEWTPGVAKAPSNDDSWASPASLCGKRGKTRLTAAGQRRVATSYVAGAVQLMTGADHRNLRLFDGSPVRVGPVTKAPVISQSVGGGKVTLVAGRDAVPAAGGPAGIFACRGYAGNGRRNCGRGVDFDLTPHWPPADPSGLPSRPGLAMNWKKAGPTARLDLRREFDLTGMASLDLRVVVDPSTRAARVGVLLRDADGRSINLRPAARGRVNAMPSGDQTPGRWLARTLRAPLPQPEAGAFDLSRVTGVWLKGKGKPECPRRCGRVSRIRLLDISARPPATLPAPSTGRLPLVRLKPVRGNQGAPGKRAVKVPFRVSGEITDPHARFRVLIDGDTGTRRPPRPVTVPLAPGQKTGSVRVTYRRKRSDRGVRHLFVDAYPLRGAIPVSSSVTVRLR